MSTPSHTYTNNPSSQGLSLQLTVTDRRVPQSSNVELDDTSVALHLYTTPSSKSMPQASKASREAHHGRHQTTNPRLILESIQTHLLARTTHLLETSNLQPHLPPHLHAPHMASHSAPGPLPSRFSGPTASLVATLHFRLLHGSLDHDDSATVLERYARGV